MAGTLPLKDKNKDFFEQVYAVVRLIPSGRVTSYGSVAKYLGAARGARMVGWAMNGCLKAGNDVPAHRVVNREGLLTGKFHFPTLTAMQERLESEGVVVVDDKIQNFSAHYWDPMLELAL